MTNQSSSRRQLALHLPVLVGFIILIAGMNWPLVAHMRTHVIGTPSDDVFEALWQLRWMRSALVEQCANPFYTPEIYFPKGWHLASGAQPPWYLLILSIPILFINDILNYNIMILSCFIISGFGSYCLSYHLTRHRLASFIAGSVYCVAPVLTLRLRGHLNILLGAQWLPFVALTLLLSIEGSRRTARRWAALAGVFLGLSIIGHWYYLFISILPFIGIFLFAHSLQPWRERLLLVPIVGATCFILVAPCAYLAFQARTEMLGNAAQFSLIESDLFSLSIERLFIPNPFHPLWGPASQKMFPLLGEHGVVSIGYTAACLAIIGLLKGARAARRRPFVAMAIISLVLAMGTTLHWNGQHVLIPIPPFVTQATYQSLGLSLDAQSSMVPVPLPGLFLAKFLPFYDAMRVWARFDIQFMLSISALSGLGEVYCVSHCRIPRILIAVLGALIIGEGWIAPYHNPYDPTYRYFTPVSVNAREPVVEWLAAHPKDTAIIEYPRPMMDKVAMYSQSLHGLCLVNGFMSWMPQHLKKVDARLGEWPNPDTLPLLREWGVEYIVVNGSSEANFGEQLVRINSLVDLRRVRSFNVGMQGLTETHIFQVLPIGAHEEQARATVQHGFYAWEPGTDSRFFCWTNGDALLTFPWLLSDPEEPTSGCLTLELAGGRSQESGPCTLQVYVEDAILFTGELPKDFAPHLLVLNLDSIENTDSENLDVRLVSNTWKPGDNPSERPLGLMFYDARLEPFTPDCEFIPQ